jgi:starch synthase
MASNDYKTVYTIHNLAHQGMVDPSVLDGLGMKDSFTMDRLEFFGSVNLMKGALLTSDAVTTVSPRYAQEITGKPLGMGLEGVIREQQSKIRGILNGLDTRYWDPSTDQFIPCNYTFGKMAGKRTCKDTLLKQSGLRDISRPLLTMVGRLYSQKGIELVIENMEQIIQEGANIFILGSGEETFERILEQKAASFPDRIAFARGYNEPLAHLVYAAGDIFLMPSLFEPCGLSQLIALRYGNIPLVRETGGLADTIVDADKNIEGYGFVFSDFSSSSMLFTCERALQTFYSKERWNNIVARAIAMDFSWDRSAPEYQSLYSEVLKQRTRTG